MRTEVDTHSVGVRPEGLNPPYIVVVTHQDNMWIAECDELCLVTEAPTYDELTERVWEVMPDLVEANGLACNIESMCLSFQHLEHAAAHQRVN